MKVKLLFFILFLSVTKNAFPCDICGCGVGSFYIGILPEYTDKFIGLRYQSKLLTTHLSPTGNRTPLTTDERYQSVEVWGAWNFGSKWRVLAIVPYNFNQRTIEASSETGYKSGLGDVIGIVNYKVFESRLTTDNSKLLVHSLWAGMGIKAPTGRYEDAERQNSSPDSPNNFQLGSGSTDFLLNIAYDLRLMDAGINLNASYKLNTENQFEYRYGNKLTGNLLAYYKFNIQNKWRIAPNTGLILETQQKDIIYNQYEVAQSGGNLLSSVLGIEINSGKISLGANYQIPISQNLADGRVYSGNRLMTHVSFTF
jgi:hypothetical protein